MMASSSSSTTGVPPGFRFHPTDEELLLYYLKKKISFDKFDIEVIREVDLNKIEPWDLQDRCSIGSTPQNEWYFFSHKDRKYPTGSRTNRATTAGFWKATGRDKCIRTSYQKIGMRKTLVFYRGRAPHGQKTDWIMHEYRLEESDEEALGGGTEDGWVVCRVFKKKCFFKIEGSQENTSHGMENHMNTSGGHDQSRVYSSQYMLQHPHLLHHQNASLYGKTELGLHYPLMQAPSYSHVQVQDLLPNHRSGGYDFSLLPISDSAAMSKPYQACDGALEVEACQQIQQEGREGQNDWGMLDNIEGRFGGAGAPVQQMDQMSKQQRGGEIDLRGYGK